MSLKPAPIPPNLQRPYAETSRTMSDTDALISRSDLVSAAARIEPLPASVSRLLQVTAAEDFSAADVVEVVQFDPALAGDVLARANSAMSGARDTIVDVRQAAARIGATSVVEIAVSRAMRDRLAAPAPVYGLGPDALFRHGLIASVAADVVRRCAGVPVPNYLATAALVHDVGKLVIAECIPEAFADALLPVAEAESITLDEAERRVLGVDHGEVSGFVVRTWGMPVTVQTALTSHHALDATTDTLTHALAIADRIAHLVDELDPSSDDEGSDDVFEPASLAAGVERSFSVCKIPIEKAAEIVIDAADAAASALVAFR